MAAVAAAVWVVVAAAVTVALAAVTVTVALAAEAVEAVFVAESQAAVVFAAALVCSVDVSVLPGHPCPTHTATAQLLTCVRAGAVGSVCLHHCC